MKKIMAIMLAAVLVLCFAGCSKDKAPEISEGKDNTITNDTLVENNFKYAVNDSGNYEIVGYITDGATDVNITVPSEIGGRPVTGIGNDAFKAVKTLKTIVIPESVTYIGEAAFLGCDGLVEITLPNSVKTIEKMAFSNCINLKKITLSNALETIDAYAFSYCQNLTDIVLPASLNAIGDGAFYECNSLEGIVIPKSVTSIGAGAFIACNKLANVVFEETNGWQSANVDGEGNVILNQKNEIVYSDIAAELLASAETAKVFFENGTILVRVVEE
jgi:hypothetical protein